MTKNQIDYWRLQEEKRHNLQDESVSKGNLAETKRMNTYTAQHYMRSDAINAVNARTNMYNATTNAVNAKTNATNAATNAYKAQEEYRHNRMSESMTARDLSRKEDELQETIRSHKANENINTVSNEIAQRNADISEYNAFTNRINAETNQYEAETGRLNYSVNARNAESNARNAASNERNAATNARNADINAMNATTNARNAEVNEYNAMTSRFNADTSRYNAETNRMDTSSLIEQRRHQNTLTDVNVENVKKETQLTESDISKRNQETDLLKKQNKTYYYNTALGWMNDTLSMSSEATRDLTGAGKNILTSVFSLLR